MIFAWADELAKWQEGREAWVNLEFGLRCGTRPRSDHLDAQAAAIREGLNI
jgi:phage terminase large subunit-like protein